MKKVCLFVTAVFLMLLASCGDGEKTTTKSFGTISPVTEKINGPLGQYYEVVIKDYKPSDRNKVSVELKRVQEGFPEPWNAKMKVGYGDGCFEPLFTAEFQDEDGNVLSKDKTDIVIERDELEALAALLVGETCTIGFDVRDEKTRKVKLTSTFEVHEAESYAESTYEEETGDEDDLFADTEIDIDNADSGDFEKLLKEYEQFVNKYVSVLNKASNGNLSAIAECAEMLEEAERLSSQLDGAKGKMTSAQVNRLLKIENKMAGLATKAAGLEDKMERKMEDVKDKIENLDVDDILNNATNNLFGDF